MTRKQLSESAGGSTVLFSESVDERRAWLENAAREHPITYAPGQAAVLRQARRESPQDSSAD